MFKNSSSTRTPRAPKSADAAGAGRKVFFRRKKSCPLTGANAPKIDYKDVKLLSRFISERGKVVPRRISGNCALHQRKVTLAIKRARNIALLPFTVTS